MKLTRTVRSRPSPSWLRPPLPPPPRRRTSPPPLRPLPPRPPAAEGDKKAKKSKKAKKEEKKEEALPLPLRPRLPPPSPRRSNNLLPGWAATSRSTGKTPGACNLGGFCLSVAKPPTPLRDRG